jgi:hypothetical protein
MIGIFTTNTPFALLNILFTLQYTTMSEPDLATRAPESDLAEQSAIPGDTAVDQGASLGVCYHIAERQVNKC